jgi:hypothetical protein
VHRIKDLKKWPRGNKRAAEPLLILIIIIRNYQVPVFYICPAPKTLKWRTNRYKCTKKLKK